MTIMLDVQHTPNRDQANGANQHGQADGGGNLGRQNNNSNGNGNGGPGNNKVGRDDDPDNGNILYDEITAQEANSLANPANLGYFNPDLVPSPAGLITDGTKTIYTDIYAFTNRLTDAAHIAGEAVIKRNWDRCLLGAARSWYDGILSPQERSRLRACSMATLINRLVERYKSNPSVSHNNMVNAIFGFPQVAQKHDIIMVLQNMVLDAKSCEMGEVEQLRTAFDALDGDLQSTINYAYPREGSSLDTLLDTCRQVDPAWSKMAAERKYQR